MDTTLSPLTVQIIVSLFIPILTGLLTKITLPGGVKAIITLVLNAVAALVIAHTVDGGQAVISQAVFQQWIIGLAISVAAYLGVYKPNSITSSETDGKLAPNSGVGSSTGRG